MFDIIESTNDIGRRVFTVRNTENGKDLGTFTFYDDALRKMRILQNAKTRRLIAANMRATQQTK